MQYNIQPTNVINMTWARRKILIKIKHPPMVVISTLHKIMWMIYIYTYIYVGVNVINAYTHHHQHIVRLGIKKKQTRYDKKTKTKYFLKELFLLPSSKKKSSFEVWWPPPKTFLVDIVGFTHTHTLHIIRSHITNLFHRSQGYMVRFVSVSALELIKIIWWRKSTVSSVCFVHRWARTGLVWLGLYTNSFRFNPHL